MNYAIECTEAIPWKDFVQWIEIFKKSGGGWVSNPDFYANRCVIVHYGFDSSKEFAAFSLATNRIGTNIKVANRMGMKIKETRRKASPLRRLINWIKL